MTKIWILAPFSMALAACTTHGMAGSSTMLAEIAEADAELARHHQTVMDAASLPEVVDESGTHQSNMSRIMEGMDEAMSGALHHARRARP